MNANELADELESCRDYELPEFVHKTAVMLRQQQAEIEALKKLVSEMKYEKSSGVYEMNNEPVAYIDPYDLERLPHYDCHIGSQQLKNGIPLYTHPAKELTDKEITEIWQTDECYQKAQNFARAILRKAQEK